MAMVIIVGVVTDFEMDFNDFVSKVSILPKEAKMAKKFRQVIQGHLHPLVFYLCKIILGEKAD